MPRLQDDKNTIQVFPEHLDKRRAKSPYKVRPGDAAVSKAQRVLFMDDSKSSKAKLIHEYGHIIWSPASKRKYKEAFKDRAQACIEDGRVNLALKRAGLPVGAEDDLISFQLIAEFVSKTNPVEVMFMAIARLGTGGEEAYRQLADRLTPQFNYVVDYVARELNDPTKFDGPFTASYAITERLIEELSEMFSDKDEDKDEGKDAFEPGKEPGKPVEGAESKLGKPEPEPDPELDGKPKPKVKSSKSDKEPKVDGDKGTTPPPAEETEETTDTSPAPAPPSSLSKYRPSPLKPYVKFETHVVKKFIPEKTDYSLLELEGIIAGDDKRTQWMPLYDHTKSFPTKPVASHIMAKHGRAVSRCAAEGSVIKRVDRLYSDGYIFRAPVRNRVGWNGGTVVVDISGSMNIEYDEVLALLKKAPYRTTVAAYSGSYSSTFSRTLETKIKSGKLLYDSIRPSKRFKNYGVLLGFASDGKVIRPEALAEVINYTWAPLGANGCDGPVLKWLARMPAPRIWVCDGYVSGESDHPSKLLKQICRLLCKKHDIVMIPSVASAIKYINTGDKSFIGVL